MALVQTDSLTRTDRLLRLGGCGFIFVNAAHKLLYPYIGVQYVSPLLLQFVPVDPAMVAYLFQVVSIAAALLVVLDRYVVPASLVLAGITAFVAVNLFLPPLWFDMAIRESVIVVVFLTIAARARTRTAEHG